MAKVIVVSMLNELTDKFELLGVYSQIKLAAAGIDKVKPKEDRFINGKLVNEKRISAALRKAHPNKAQVDDEQGYALCYIWRTPINESRLK